VRAGAATWFAPAVLAVLVVATDVWVFQDARTRSEKGTPVSFTAGEVTMESPAAWLLRCLLIWLIFVPLYLRARRA
jgi:hypothetical protein